MKVIKLRGVSHFALVVVCTMATAAATGKFTDPQCKGLRQSPVNIDVSTALPARSSPLIMDYFSKRVTAINATNNGDSVIFRLQFADARESHLIWNGTEIYILDSLHFHWGSFRSGGNEHTINGVRYASEVHLVHYNAKYGSVKAALSHSDGLAVVGVFFQLSRKGLTYKSEKFTRFLYQVRHPQQTYRITDPKGIFTVQELIKFPVSDYWNYEGSLTTDPCSEAVKWIVSKRSVKIHISELTEMSKVLDAQGSPIVENYRPVQPLNGRQVYSFSHPFIPTRLQILHGVFDKIF